MTQVWGHRGASKAKPENTIEAFAEARRLGADGVELDVRRTADNAMAVRHDFTLEGGGTIVEHTLDALPSSVPTLAAALDACGPMTVNVEIKNVPIEPDYDPDETVADQVVDLVVARDAIDQIVVSSFSLATIDAVRKRSANIATGWLTLVAYDQLEALETAVERGHSALHPYFTAVTTELVEAAHAAGVAVYTWTVDDPDDMRRLADMGVDAIMTNDVELAVRVLQRQH